MIRYFLLTNENTDQGLIKTQLIDPLENKYLKKFKIINIISPLFLFKKFKTKNLIKIPFLFPPKGFSKLNLLIFLLNIFLIVFLIGIFIKYIKREKCEIIARNYYSGTIALFLKSLFKIDFIFDPRSLFILENIDYKFKKNSFQFIFWSFLEKNIVANCSQIICVSYGMKRYYKILFKKENIKLIPCFNNIKDKEIKLFDQKELFRIDKILSLPNDYIKIIYYGSLNYGWNNINLYYEYVKNCLKRPYSFIFITQDYDKGYINKLKKLKNITVFSEKNIPSELTIEDIFLYADYGLLLFNKTADWYTRLGVKYAQYTSFGLPVITNKWAGEANRLIKELPFKKPLIINRNFSLEIKKTKRNQKLLIAKWARRYFDSNKINLI